LDKLESNGVTAYIDPGLNNFIRNYGDIHIDYINEGPGRQGFMLRVGSANCGESSGGCSSCG